MRCCLLTFTLSMSLLNYVFGIPATRGLLFGNEDDYTSGEQVPLIGIIKENNRSLVVGDTLTPQEMLPIAEKLLQKVEQPGHGKGFVSSTKGPQELADKLYEAIFMNTKRINVINVFDMTTMEALQALAIGGEEADKNLINEEVTKAAEKMYLRDQLVDIKKSNPKRSHYKLVTKVVPVRVQKTKKKGKRRGIPLSKKLPPKRHLVVNERPHKRERTQKINRKYNKKVTKGMVKNNKHDMKNSSSLGRKTPQQERNKGKCRWKYVCSKPGDLDTCHVHTTCGNSSSLVTSVQKQNDKNDMLIKEFRRMVKITDVDEEVEKILEIRNLKLRPVKLEPMERVESLAEFFNNIVVRENMESTTSIPNKIKKDSSNHFKLTSSLNF